MTRVHRRANARPITWGETVPVRDQQPVERGVVSRAHKERILELLVEAPEGLSMVELADALGLARGSVYTYVSQLQAQGLIDRYGAQCGTRWIALV